MRADGTIFVSHSFQGTCRRFLGVQLGGFGLLLTCPLAGAHKPTIIALLHHIHDVPLVKLHFIIILWLVVVKCTEPVQTSGDSQWNSRCGLRLAGAVGHGGAWPGEGGVGAGGAQGRLGLLILGQVRRLGQRPILRRE